VTKRPPFLGASAFLTISKVIKDPPEPPTKLNASVSPALERTVMKALSKEPIDRFHTCADLRKALEAPG
jgi:eukaryotic-like serine/threonine-protein kinase